MLELKVKEDVSIDNLTEECWRYYKNDREIEHQVGRLMHMKQIFKEIKDNNIQGDVIEFGVWTGFSLMWLARLRDLHGLNDRRIIGVDSFVGLPEEGHLWNKGQFSDTSVAEVYNTLSTYLTKDQNKNIIIIKSRFDKTILPKDLKKLSLIHMDCDLKSSLISAFSLIESYIYGEQYILLDDWGVTDQEIPVGFKIWETTHPSIDTTVHSKTNLTRYYKTKALF